MVVAIALAAGVDVAGQVLAMEQPACSEKYETNSDRDETKRGQRGWCSLHSHDLHPPDVMVGASGIFVASWLGEGYQKRGGRLPEASSPGRREQMGMFLFSLPSPTYAFFFF